MSVREYIGARYLPLFPDDPQWSSANTYEPLTVVQNLGSSYISRQYVPAGIQLSNTDYWVLWADFNSQIEQYRSEVQAFDGRITANTNDIDALEAILPKSAFSTSNTVSQAIDSVKNVLPINAFTTTNTVKSNIDDLSAKIDANTAITEPVSQYTQSATPTDGGASKRIVDMFECVSTYLANIATLEYKTGANVIQAVSYHRSSVNTDEWEEYGALTPSAGRYPIDCESFAQLVLMGVPFEKSKLAGLSSNTRQYSYGQEFNGNGPAASYYFTREHTTDAETVSNGRYWVQMLAKYFRDNGKLAIINGPQDLNVGDFVFFTQENAGTWKNIVHVDIFTGKTVNNEYKFVGSSSNYSNAVSEVTRNPATSPFLNSQMYIYRPSICDAATLANDVDVTGKYSITSNENFQSTGSIQANKLYTIRLKGSVSAQCSLVIYHSGTSVNIARPSVNGTFDMIIPFIASVASTGITIGVRDRSTDNAFDLILERFEVYNGYIEDGNEVPKEITLSNTLDTFKRRLLALFDVMANKESRTYYAGTRMPISGGMTDNHHTFAKINKGSATYGTIEFIQNSEASTSSYGARIAYSSVQNGVLTNPLPPYTG